MSPSGDSFGTNGRVSTLGTGDIFGENEKPELPENGSSPEGGLPFSMSRRDVLESLKDRGFRFDHRKGQNFLFDGNLLRALVRDSGVSAGSTVLEVGPGAGTLTSALLGHGCQVIAVELDPILVEHLRTEFGDSELKVIEADALATKNRLSEPLLSALPQDEFHLVANLPYSIASPLVCMLVEQCPQMASFSVLVQREVAERWVAGPATREYGTSSVLLGFLGEARIMRHVPPHAFIPAPRVDSSFVRWQRSWPVPEVPKGWMALVRECFQGRRKSLSRLLGKKGVQSWSVLGVEPGTRPDQVSPEQWVELAQICSAANPDND